MTLVGSTTANASFTPTVAGSYAFRLIVNDGLADSTPAITTVTVCKKEDPNMDGKVDCADLAIVKASFGKRSGQAGFDPRADLNRDGLVDVRDLALVSRQLPVGTRCP